MKPDQEAGQEAAPMQDMGDWLVDIEPEYPDYVHIQFSEISDTGIDGFTLYMPPDIALEFAKAVREHAEDLQQ